MTEPKPRAKRGTGSIITRDRKIYAQWSSKDPATGARKQHRAGPFKNDTAARKHLTQQLGKVDTGTFVAPPKPMLVSELLNRWLDSRAEIRPTSRQSYKMVIDKWLTPRIGGTKVAALSAEQVRELMRDLAEHGRRGDKPLAARSVILALITLRAALRWGISEGTVVRDVTVGIRTARPHTAMKAWSASEARTFLAAIANERDVALFTLALTRGCRRGELIGLKWENVDLDAATMAIRNTIVLVNNRPAVSVPKTASGVRSIPLDAQLVKVLKAHRGRQSAERLKAGGGWLDSGYVFTNEAGELLNPDHVSNRWEKLCVKAKVPPIRLHDARHSAASIMLANGVPVKVVSEMLGHADVKITLSVYAHVLPGMSADAGAKLSALLL